VLIDSGGSARALPPKPHHLPLAPKEPIQWAHILSLRLQRRVVSSNDASAALTVIIAHDFVLDFLIKRTRGDCTDKRDQEAILGHLNLILTLLHRTIDAKNYVGVVIDSFGVVMGREGVSCIDGEAGCGGGGGGWGGRVCSGSGTLLLGGSLFWNRLYLGRHGCVFDVVGGGSVVGGVDVFVGVVGVIVVDALFVLI